MGSKKKEKKCTGIEGVGWEGGEGENVSASMGKREGNGLKKFLELMPESHSISLKRKPPKNFNQPIPQPKAPSRFPLLYTNHSPKPRSSTLHMLECFARLIEGKPPN